MDETPQHVPDETDNTFPFLLALLINKFNFFIIVEKNVLCQVPNVQSAIFLNIFLLLCIPSEIS